MFRRFGLVRGCWPGQWVSTLGQLGSPIFEDLSKALWYVVRSRLGIWRGYSFAVFRRRIRTLSVPAEICWDTPNTVRLTCGVFFSLGRSGLPAHVVQGKVVSAGFVSSKRGWRRLGWLYVVPDPCGLAFRPVAHGA